MKFSSGLFLMLLISVSCNAQVGNCDSLTITDIKLNIFNSSEILVRASYTDFDNFINYPGFQMLDAEENVLAFETVDYFGLGTNQVHKMEILALDVSPNQTIEGSLQLWSGFYDAFECAFDTVGLIVLKDSICYPVQLRISSLGKSSSTGYLNWSIENESIEFLLEDSINFDGNITNYNIDYCLPVGCGYNLNFYVDTLNGVGFSYTLHYRDYLSVGAQGLLSSANLITEDDFTILECISIPTEIAEIPKLELKVFPNPSYGIVNVVIPKSLKYSDCTIEIYDALGQKVKSKAATEWQNTLICSELSGGVYHVALLKEGLKVASTVLILGH